LGNKEVLEMFKNWTHCIINIQHYIFFKLTRTASENS